MSFLRILECESAFCAIYPFMYDLYVGNPNRLTTREVARICRVSDATVKRWALAGLIESERTNGGHRRFRAEDVARFTCDKQLGVGQTAGDNSIVTTPTTSRMRKDLGGSELFCALICGCDESVANLLIREVLDGKPLAEIIDTHLAPELKRIGEHWLEGKISVAEEHLASQAVTYALFRLRSVLPATEPCNRLAFCSGIEGDYHGLSTNFACLIFENLGWTVLNFGPNTPLFALRQEVAEHKPEAVCISASLLEDIERLTTDYSDLKKTLTANLSKAIVGGRAFNPTGVRSRFPADFYPETFTELAEIVKTIS